MKRRVRLTNGLHGFRDIVTTEPVNILYKGTAKPSIVEPFVLGPFKIDEPTVKVAIPDNIIIRVV